MNKLIFIFCSFLSMTAMAQIPADWYQAPEDSNMVISSRISPLSEEQRSGISKFYSNLNEMIQQIDIQKKRSWQLSQISLNSSVTSEGIFGLLPINGTISSTLSWERSTSSASHQNSSTDLTLKSTNSEQQDVRLVTSWFQEYLKQKNIPLNLDQQKDLIKMIQQARSIAQDLSHANHPSWQIDQLVLERGITVKGVISPTISAEATAIFRIAYEIVPNRSSSTSELTEMAKGLLEDIADSTKDFSLPGWALNGFSLGLGSSISLGFGIVKVKPEAFAYFHIQPKNQVSKGSYTPSTMSSYQLIENNPSAQHLQFAKRNSLKFLTTKNSRSQTSSVAYIVNRAKFRKGLKKALHMSQKLTAEALKSDQDEDRWRLTKVLYGYSTSVNGILSLAQVKGSVTADVQLIRSQPRRTP